MLDIKFIRENPDIVKAAIKNRNLKLNIQEVLGLDSERRKILVEVEGLKAEKNTISK
ncbi:MAG: serine--tRNA ligase, partial [Candidatus Omnitrophica bacterium CG02_land_8_20_14_3_00__42_8]